MTRRAQALVDAERRVDDRRLLHVDADERAQAFRARDQPLQVRERQVFAHFEPEMRQLEGHVRPQPFRYEPVEDLLVGTRHRLRACLVGRRLAEQRRIGVKASVVEGMQHRHALVERHSGDEAARAEPHPVLLYDPLQPRAVRGPEDGSAWQLRDVGRQRHDGDSTAANAARVRRR